MKRVYRLVSLVALVQLLAAVGFAGYLFARGRLNRERIEQIAAVLRGEAPGAPAPTTQPVATTARPESATSQIARSSEQQELAALIVERQKRELEDRARLNQSIQLDVVRKLEEIDRRDKAFADRERRFREQQMQDGFARELEVLSQIDPVRARKLLMMQKETHAVRLVMAMEPARTKKIFDSCKAVEEMEWARRILDQIEKLNSEQATTAGSGQSGAEATGASPTPPTGG